MDTPGGKPGTTSKRCGKGDIEMMSEEALIGIRVRVRESLVKYELRQKEGTIMGRWGSPDYVALDVLLDDGSTQLFWHHELEEIKLVD